MENVSNESSHEGVKIMEAHSFPCQPYEKDVFNRKNISKCQKYVFRIQRKLDAAVAASDKPKIRWYQHLLTKRSRAVKILAVHRITKENDGKYTAGVDKVAIPKNASKECTRNLSFAHFFIGEATSRFPSKYHRIFPQHPQAIREV